MAMDPILVPNNILTPPDLDNESLDEDMLELIDEELFTTNFSYVNDSKNKYKSKTYLVYDEEVEMKNEVDDFNSHLYKNNDSWISAKTIVSSSIKNNKSQSFFWDYLDILFKNNSDDFNNIQKVIYSSNCTLHEFNNTIAKYIVDNLKINNFKPSGYIFSSTDNNAWDFKIIVVTSKNVYSSNRYIDENTIGFY